jgi:hypothetical protein
MCRTCALTLNSPEPAAERMFGLFYGTGCAVRNTGGNTKSVILSTACTILTVNIVLGNCMISYFARFSLTRFNRIHMAIKQMDRLNASPAQPLALVSSYVWPRVFQEPDL